MKKQKLFDEHPWHALSPSVIYEKLSSSEQGLTCQEAQRRLAQFGYNELSLAKGQGPLKRFINQFHNVLVYVLLIAGGVTAAIGQTVDSGVIVGVVFVNAFAENLGNVAIAE
jgi:magnesium-transporting ATPase (P-type)